MFFYVTVVNSSSVFDAPLQTVAYYTSGVKGNEAKNFLKLKLL